VKTADCMDFIEKAGMGIKRNPEVCARAGTALLQQMREN